MTIAIFTECYHPIVNGVVVSVDTFTTELKRLGFHVDIYAPAFPGERENEDHLFRFPSLSLPTNPRYPLGIPFSPRLGRAARESRPDLVHTQSPFMMGCAGARLARRLGVPLVFTYHTLLEAYVHYIPLPRPLVRWCARTLSREYANRADCVVAPSAGAQAVLRGYGVHRRIEVIPTGVDLSLANGAPPAGVRARWGIPEGAPLLIYVGRLALEKSPDLMLRAFGEVRWQLPQARLLVVGGGPWERLGQTMAQEMGVQEAVRWTGYLPRQEVFGCLGAADLFLFPSLTDTQGIVLVEAMSVGLPCVAVRSGAAEEVVGEGEEACGMLVDPHPQALAEAALALLREEPRRRTMGARARRRAQEFSARACAQRLAALYRELAG